MMTPTILYRPTGPAHPIKVTKPAALLEAFQRAFGQHHTGHGWILDQSHVPTLEGIRSAICCGDSAAIAALIDAVRAHGEVTVWAEWPDETL